MVQTVCVYNHNIHDIDMFTSSEGSGGGSSMSLANWYGAKEGWRLARTAFCMIVSTDSIFIVIH